MDWVTIDFEASCLPRDGRSFPIEVGICGPFGTCSWLIRPQPEWRQWDWTDEAFRLHGIERDRLDREGIDPAVVVAEVLQAVSGSRVVADSTIDRIWWQTLLDAAAPVAPKVPLIIEHVGDVFDELRVTDDRILQAQRRADRLCPTRHRAGADARWLFTLLSTLTEPDAHGGGDAANPSYPSWTSRDAYVRGVSQPEPVREPAKPLV